jgi:hypothetical protein
MGSDKMLYSPGGVANPSLQKRSRHACCTPAACDQANLKLLHFFVKHFLRTLVFLSKLKKLLDFVRDRNYLFLTGYGNRAEPARK